MGKKLQQNFKNLTMQEAIEWTRSHCSFADVRNRMVSRQVAWMLLNALESGTEYVAQLEQQNAQLKELLSLAETAIRQRDARIASLEK